MEIISSVFLADADNEDSEELMSDRELLASKFLHLGTILANLDDECIISRFGVLYHHYMLS